jgi:Zn finger protein HypA/HybF involved in hydrogenase expression
MIMSNETMKVKLKKIKEKCPHCKAKWKGDGWTTRCPNCGKILGGNL